MRFALKELILIVLISFVAGSAHAQKLLFHKNRYREAIYKAGDVLTFRLRGDKTRIALEIKGFEDSVIVFKDYRINPTEITHLYLDKKTKIWYFLRLKHKRLFLYAGLIYLGSELVNAGNLDDESLAIGGGLLATSLLARIFIHDRMKIKGRRKLVILH